MPMQGIEQPELIQIDGSLRLRKYDGCHEFAFAWYQDRETVRLVDGVDVPYTWDKLGRMCRCLDARGELYFIERKREVGAESCYVPIGDITLCRDDMPIVVGEKSLRGQGIGRKAVAALVQRAKQLGWDAVSVREIYDFNVGSKRCFESIGFYPCRKSGGGTGYRLDL